MYVGKSKGMSPRTPSKFGEETPQKGVGKLKKYIKDIVVTSKGNFHLPHFTYLKTHNLTPSPSRVR